MKFDIFGSKSNCPFQVLERFSQDSSKLEQIVRNLFHGNFIYRGVHSFAKVGVAGWVSSFACD